MPTPKFIDIHESLTQQYYIWAGLDTRNGEITVDVFKKVQKGIRHITTRYDTFNVQKIKKDVSEYGFFLYAHIDLHKHVTGQ